ncbi:hypothetical protein G5C60_33130 [Streptomyces sp. HC44]|uniref:DUF4386 family protein n=1 Tax=Streptomyces scabichelini TaxID=2711217 RepID=A0A6G4VDZ6_9ACTN|nr:hypothetical protein [Streptomyces scabichelini]NGO12319.1 hypothetical protein [Streptomyces scabichelini]
MRVAPLSGLLAVALTVVSFLLIGDTPDVDSSGREVRTYYEDHEAQTAVSLYLLVLAGAFFVFFAAHLARAVRDAAPRDDWTHRVVLAGGVLIAAGFWVAAGFALALMDLADESAASDDTMQTLNAITEDFFIPFVGGMALMLLAAGLAAARVSVTGLPRWLGWTGFALGVLTFVPWVGFVTFMLSGLWVIVASVLLARRPHNGTPTEPTAASGTAPSPRT